MCITVNEIRNKLYHKSIKNAFVLITKLNEMVSPNNYLLEMITSIAIICDQTIRVATRSGFSNFVDFVRILVKSVKMIVVLSLYSLSKI